MTSPTSPSPLVAHHGALGDLVMLTPMLQALACRWRRPCDLVSGLPAAGRLLSGAPFVGEVRLLGARRRPYWTSPGQQALVAWLRERRQAPCWVIEPRRHPVAPWSRLTRFEWLLERAGVRRVVTSATLARAPLEHAVDFQARLAAVEPIDLTPPGELPEPYPRPVLAVTEDEVAECRAWLSARGWRSEPLVLVQTQSRRSTTRGRWPAGRWRDLVAGVLALVPEARVLLLGVREEHRLAAEIVRWVGDRRVWDVTIDLPLRRLLALQSVADSMISVDTGPAHTAAALGCPVAVLQGSADPRRNRPLGRPGAVEIVTGYGDRPWPDSPHVWFNEHRLASIGVALALQAWQRVRSVRRAAAPRAIE